MQFTEIPFLEFGLDQYHTTQATLRAIQNIRYNANFFWGEGESAAVCNNKPNALSFACIWPKDYWRGSLRKCHINYLKRRLLKTSNMKKILPQNLNLQPLDYRSTALSLELGRTSPRTLDFGYLKVKNSKF